MLSSTRRNQLLKVLPLVEMLEDRLTPSWGSTPPATITPPSSYTSVTLNGSGDATGNATIATTEIDWYKFTATTGGSYIFQATTPSSSLDTVIATYTSTGSRVGYNDDITSGSNTDSRFTVTLTAGAAYFFGVTNYTGTAGGSYTWLIDGPVASGGDDAYENNDTSATAYNLGTLATTQTYNSLKMADAADYYKFTMNGAGTAVNSVSIAFTHAQGDLDMRLYNSAGTQVGSSEGTGNTETISLNGLTAGTYTVHVFGYNGAQNPNYSMTINPGTSGGTGGGTNDWTIMVYVTASSLYSFANTDINEMEYAASQLGSTVKIVAFWDQSVSGTKYATGSGTQAAWGTAGRAVIAADTNLSSVKTTFELVGEQNTGNPTTLSGFMTWAASAAPANNYSLILWNHGAGIYGSNFDDSDGGTMDYLTIAETANALAATGMPAVKVFGYDACLMAMAEIGYTMRNAAPVFVGSEELEPGAGHDYKTLFNVLKTNPAAVTPEQLGAGYVTSYQTQYQGTGPEDTYSAIRTSQYGNLATALKAFTDATIPATAAERTAMQTARNNAIQYDGTSYVDFRDLGSFMTNVANNTSISTAIRNAANGVKTAITGAVIAKTADQRSSSGIAIYLPQTSMDTGYASAFSAFDAATGWASFCNWLVTGSRGGGGGGGGGGGRSRGPAHRGGETTIQVSAASTPARADLSTLVNQSEIIERIEADATFAGHTRGHRAAQKIDVTPMGNNNASQTTAMRAGQSFDAWKSQLLAKQRKAAANNTFALGFDRLGSLAGSIA